MRYFPLTLLAVLLPFSAPRLLAGGSGLNTVLVVNQASSNSLALANYYAEQRQVPPQNVFRLTNWTGANVGWDLVDFTNKLLHPLLGALQSRGLTQQVWQVVLSMDIPYRVDKYGTGAGWNSTTAALLYGFKPFTTPPPGTPDSCCLPDASSNSYAFSEEHFPEAPPDTAPTNAFLAFMLTSSNLTQAKAIVDRGVASDRSYPTQRVFLAKTTDPARNVRFYYFDDAIFNSRVIGDTALVRTNTNAVLAFTNTLGIQTGLATFTNNPNSLSFVPGAMADSLTSYGGDIFRREHGQTTLLAFLDAGAVASYGTVVEPCNWGQKFPSPLNYFYQARGFSIGESYYQSLANPFEGLFVGDPLSQPFARSASVNLPTTTGGDVLRGPASLFVDFEGADARRPVQQLDLFVDGNFFRTLTNRAPTAGNVLSVTLPGRTVNYTVPANATVPVVALGLESALNAVSNLTGVAAYTYGDRLELHGLNVATLGSALPVSTASTAGSAPQATTFVHAAQPAFLDATAYGVNRLTISNPPAVGDWIRLTVIRTNGASVSFSVTNTGSTVTPLVQSLAVQINASTALQGANGAITEDIFSNEPGRAQAGFLLRARAPGWLAAQIQVRLEGSPTFRFQPGATFRLDGNWSDLRPRNHLYVSAGELAASRGFLFDTTLLPDGPHELAVVAYEGTSVRTQSRVTRQVVVQNTPLSATLTTLVGDTNAALEGTLQFRVDATPGPLAAIELFTTGGSLGRSNGLASATFSVAGAFLGEGRHPFYALATDALGRRYRTETKWIRLVSAESPFPLTLARAPLALTWPALAARQYQVQATTNLSQPFHPVATVLASNRTARWPLPNPVPAPTFYRVRSQ
jgi:uncharacterized protein (TIGR03790 family)